MCKFYMKLLFCLYNIINERECLLVVSGIYIYEIQTIWFINLIVKVRSGMSTKCQGERKALTEKSILRVPVPDRVLLM